MLLKLCLELLIGAGGRGEGALGRKHSLPWGPSPAGSPCTHHLSAGNGLPLLNLQGAAQSGP